MFAPARVRTVTVKLQSVVLVALRSRRAGWLIGSRPLSIPPVQGFGAIGGSQFRQPAHGLPSHLKTAADLRCNRTLLQAVEPLPKRFGT